LFPYLLAYLVYLPLYITKLAVEMGHRLLYTGL
jgi:hypothetical protein